MEKLHTIKLIGQGSYGKVYHVKNLKNNKEYAIKKIKLLYGKENIGNLTELQILNYNKCDYLIKYHYSYLENNQLCIITDFYKKGDLLNIVKKKKKKMQNFNEEYIWKIFLDLCMSINYVHNNNIIHRDLKSANIFIDSNDRAYLGDFGVSKILGSLPKTSTQIGTPFYMSPELFNKIKYDKKVDMWSLGCILYELITLNQPFFQSKSIHTLCFKIISGKIPKIYTKKYSKELIKIIDYLLEINPEKRLSINELLEIDFIKEKLKKYNYKILNENIDIPPLPKTIPQNIREWKNKVKEFQKEKNKIDDISSFGNGIIYSKKINEQKKNKISQYKQNNATKSNKPQNDIISEYKKNIILESKQNNAEKHYDYISRYNNIEYKKNLNNYNCPNYNKDKKNSFYNNYLKNKLKLNSIEKNEKNKMNTKLDPIPNNLIKGLNNIQEKIIFSRNKLKKISPIRSNKVNYGQNYISPYDKRYIYKNSDPYSKYKL